MEIHVLTLSSAAKPLTEDQKLAISTVFAEELAKNIPLTRGVIYEKIARNTTVKDLTSCSSSMKRVSNYLSYQPTSPTFQHRVHLHACWKVGERPRGDSLKSICQGGLECRRHCHKHGTPEAIPAISGQTHHRAALRRMRRTQ